MINILNLLIFKISWAAIIFYSLNFNLIIPTILISLILVFYKTINYYSFRDIIKLLIIALILFLLDYLNLLFNFVNFDQNHLSFFGFPFFMYIFWVNFILIVPKSLSFLDSKYLYQYVLGFLSGSSVYFIVLKLGLLEISSYINLIFIGLNWGFIIVINYYLIRLFKIAK